jgi:alanine dehydrogenase
VHLKGADLYRHRQTGQYAREDFHANPGAYDCIFEQYVPHTDVLMNGVYWTTGMPRLFEWETIEDSSFAIRTIADITDDAGGSVPCNLGDATIQDPVYGIDRFTKKQTAPYQKDNIDIMAVGNLPNELPRDASRYFGEQLIKHVLPDLLGNGSDMLNRATILQGGELTSSFDYLRDYAAH